jgi:hypothetical protein
VAIWLVVLRRTYLSELFPHAQVQKHHCAGQEQNDEQEHPTRLDPIRVDFQEDHAKTFADCVLHPLVGRSPAVNCTRFFGQHSPEVSFKHGADQLLDIAGFSP